MLKRDQSHFHPEIICESNPHCLSVAYVSRIDDAAGDDSRVNAFSPQLHSTPLRSQSTRDRLIDRRGCGGGGIGNRRSCVSTCLSFVVIQKNPEMASLKVRVDSPKVRYTEDFIEAEYEYRTTKVAEADENNRDTYTVRIHPSDSPRECPLLTLGHSVMSSPTATPTNIILVARYYLCSFNLRSYTLLYLTE